MVIQCCVCRRVRDGGQWTSQSLRVFQEEVSHGYCPECAEKAFADIRKMRSASLTLPGKAASA